MKFEVFEPHTVDEAISLIGQNPEESRVIAGGQSLLLMIRSGLLMPRYLVSLNRISDLKQIKPGPGNKIQIGCMVTHREVLSCPMITEQANLLAQAVFRIGSTPVRNLGTLGGNVCHNEMGSDPPAALLALDATVECASVRGRRCFPVRDLFTGYFETCLAPDEILIGIEIPAECLNGVYLKHAFRGGDLAIAGVAAAATFTNGVGHDVRLALGGAGPVPFRSADAERLLNGNPWRADLIDEAAACAADACDPISDAHASADYRRKMSRVFVKRALQQLMSSTRS
jgi:CO/xanthine dehydrogenase FAD-binding subunit